jgi:RNA polymerase sigma factor (sigma-70 family)
MAGKPSASLLRQILRLVEQRHARASDQELLRRYVAGRDEEAFTAVVARHGPMVLALGRRLLGNAHDAEDVFQATFLVLARQAARVRWRASVGTWLYEVAHRLALRARADAGRRQRHEGQVQGRRPADPLDEVTLREARAVLDEELRGLPERYRAPLVLCCLEGLTRDEAARHLGLSVQVLKGRLERGRERLRRRLDERGFTLPAALAAALVVEGVALAAVSSGLVDATVQAALAFGAGAVRAGAVSPQVLVLAKGAVQAMFVTKLKLLAGAVVAVGLLGVGGGTLTRQATAGKQAAEGRAEAAQPPAQVAERPKPVAAPRVRTDRYGDPLPEGAVARVGTLRLYHGSSFTALAYAPDGKVLAAYSGGPIRLWDTATGKELRQFEGYSGGVTALAFSADGKLLAAAGWGDVKIWRVDAASDKEAYRLPAPNGGADTLAISPDGKLLAVVTKDHRLRLWQTDGWREVRQLAGYGDQFCVGLAFFPDGKTLASVSQNKTVRLWDVEQGRQLRLLSDQLDDPWAMALSPDGKRLAVAQRHGTLRLWDTGTGREVSRLTGPSDCVAFSPDSRTLAAGGFMDGKVHFWDAATGQSLRTWESAQFITRLAFAPDGKALAVGGSGMIRFRDPATGRDLGPLGSLAEAVTAVAFAEDGKTLVTGSSGSGVGFWKPATGEAVRPTRNPTDGFFPPPRLLTSPALARQGRWAALVDKEGVVWVWETVTGKALGRFGRPPAYAFRIAFAPGGELIAATHLDNVIRLWDVVRGEPVRQLGPPAEPGNALAFSPDARILATTSLKSAIHLWEVATGKELRGIRWPGNIVSHLAFSPDGKLLASAHMGDFEKEVREGGKADDVLIRIWRVASGEELRQFHGSWFRTNALVFSPDGKTLASGNYDGTVYLWEVASGKERGRFQGHRGYIFSVAFSPDGRLVASGSGDHTALVWDVTGLASARRPKALPGGSAELEALWVDLAAADAAQAYRAIWSLVTARDAVPFLAERVQPQLSPDPRLIARLIAGLNGDRFAEREQAVHELERLGELAEPGLRKALADRPSLETRRRIEPLLEKLKGPVTAPERLRPLRDVEVLEHINTPEARQVLAGLARGAPEAWLTQEAKAALERLARPPVAGP